MGVQCINAIESMIRKRSDYLPENDEMLSDAMRSDEMA